MFRRKKKVEEPAKPKNNPLFEDEDNDIHDFDSHKVESDYGSYIEMSFEEFEVAEMKGSIKNDSEDEFVEDKIFGNTYNSGEVQMSRLPEIKVKASYAARLDCYNSDTAYIRSVINERCEEAFVNSTWLSVRDEIGDKQFPKSLIPYVFNDLYIALDDGYTSTTERFIAIAELLKSSYEKVYAAVPAKIKERLIAELDESNGSITGQRITRLF